MEGMKSITLKQLREQKGVTQKIVANNVGIARSTYTLLENGTRKPSFGVAAKLADFFGVSIDIIFLATHVASSITRQEMAATSEIADES